VNSTGQSLSYLGERLTVIAAEPGYDAIRLYAGHDGPPYLLTDATYFLAKYAGLHLAPSRPYPLELYVSAGISKTPMLPGAFLVSVTLGLFAQLYADLGAVGATLLTLGAGGLLAWMVRQARRPRSPFARAAWCLAAYDLTVVLSNGNLLYHAINVAAVVGFLAVVYALASAVAWIVQSGAGASRSRAAPPEPGLEVRG
ncbi:MAG TPA: hypothetical protein VHN99_12345, partial [Deinococcales bacterium]|nr:hypothetical protein [Deinococcales bacterium]